MTHEQRTARIRTLTRELSMLLAHEAAQPARFLSAAALPAGSSIAQGFSPCSSPLGSPRARWSCRRLDRPNQC
jgi:hypothetical protein